MLRKTWVQASGMLALATVIALCAQPVVAGAANSSESSGPTTSINSVLPWQTAAQMHRIVPFTKNSGTLVIDEKGVAFQSGGERSQNWGLLDIQSFVLTPHRLILQTYNPRTLHRPGDRRYQFDLTQAVPPAVAASLAKALRRPSQNAVPDPQSPASASIPARHRRVGGGTNGVLRFRDNGIDYVTGTPGDSRSWRWADLQTLSDANPYQLVVFGYRDTYTFDLKEPLSGAVFLQAANKISAANVNDSVLAPAIPAATTTKSTGAGADDALNN